MKNLKKIFHASLLALGLFVNAESVDAQTIPTNFFGQNAWMPDTIGNANGCQEPPCIFGGKLHQQWGKVKESRASIIRFGGIAPDRNMPTYHQYIKMIDSVRAKGMEPILQVSYHKGRYTAQQAADLVQYVNITKGKNVRYWVIGNEPDLEYGYTTAAQVANYFKPFASAMKAVDASILTIGPECAWFNQPIMDGLTTPNGPNDITGKDAAGNYYLDIISFHTYPFNGTQTREAAIGKLMGANQMNDNLVYLNGRIASANTAHGRTGSYSLRTAITEANVNYKNNPSDNVNGLGVNSFFGGQFLAEMFGVGMKNGVSFMNIWSVVEGNGTELNIGYIDPFTGNKKPTYYHFKMMAEHFKGNYITTTDNQNNAKALASQNSQNTTVMLMNQDLTTNYNVTVRLNNDAIGGTSNLKVNVNAGIANEYKDVVPNQSTMLLVFNPQGALIKKVIYTLANAVANQAPVVTEFSSGGSVVTSSDDQPSDAVVQSMKGFEMNLYPNPAKSKFTIELDRNNTQDVKFQVEVYDIMGRLVYTQNSTFPGRQQKVDLSGASIAEAVYIVRVREEGDKDNWRSSKMIVFK